MRTLTKVLQLREKQTIGPDYKPRSFEVYCNEMGRMALCRDFVWRNIGETPPTLLVGVYTAPPKEAAIRLIVQKQGWWRWYYHPTTGGHSYSNGMYFFAEEELSSLFPDEKADGSAPERSIWVTFNTVP